MGMKRWNAPEWVWACLGRERGEEETQRGGRERERKRERERERERE